MDIAHRGLWNRQNKIDGIIRVSDYVDIVEVDVRANSKGVLVLCHDRDKVDEDNDTLEELCKVSKKLHIILDIKGNLAREVLDTIRKSQHTWKLASFDYRCVRDLSRMSGYEVGLITAGIPHPEAVKNIDFVIQDYDFYEKGVYDIDVYVYGTQCDIRGVNQIKNIFLDISR